MKIPQLNSGNEEATWSCIPVLFPPVAPSPGLGVWMLCERAVLMMEQVVVPLGRTVQIPATKQNFSAQVCFCLVTILVHCIFDLHKPIMEQKYWHIA